MSSDVVYTQEEGEVMTLSAELGLDGSLFTVVSDAQASVDL